MTRVRPVAIELGRDTQLLAAELPSRGLALVGPPTPDPAGASNNGRCPPFDLLDVRDPQAAAEARLLLGERLP